MTSLPPQLAKLHDIHLPPPITSWALAPGWYAVIGLLFCLGGLLFIYFRKRQSGRRLKHHVLQQLTIIETEHQLTPNSQKTAAAVSELLKQVALMCYPREQVAGLQGQAWLEFLEQTQSGELQTTASHTQNNIDFISLREALLNYPYQPPLLTQQSQAQLKRLLEAAQYWLDHQQVTIASRVSTTSHQRPSCLN